MYRLLFAVGVMIQLIALAALKIPTPLSWCNGLIAISIASVIGIGVVIAAGVKAGDRPVFRTLVFLGGIAGLIGWASWLLVALTSEKGDPVINVTGMLCVVSWVLTCCAALALVFERVLKNPTSQHTWAWLFTPLIVAIEAVSFLPYADLSALPSTGTVLFSMLLPVVVGALQIAMALRVPTRGTAKTLSIISGAVLIIPLLPGGLAALLTFAAALIEFKSTKLGATSPAINETIEE